MKSHLLTGLAAGVLLAGLAGGANAADFVTKHKGTIILAARVTTVDPTAGDPILTSANADTTLNAVVSSDTMPTIGLSYFLTDNIAVEVIAGTTKHRVQATNLPVADTWVLPPVVTLQYHFAPTQKVSPYVGAGINYMLFYSEKNIAPFSKFNIDNGFGTALQAGVDVSVGGPWSLNLDVKKVYFNTTAHTTLAGPGLLHSNVALDPLVYSLGMARRW